MSHPDDLIAAAYEAQVDPYQAHPEAIAKSQVDVRQHVRHTQHGDVQVRAHTMRVDKAALVELLARHGAIIPDHDALHAAIDRALDQHHETGGRVKHVRFEGGQWRTSNTKPAAEPGQPMLHVGGGKVKATVGGELKGHAPITQEAAIAPDPDPVAPPIEPVAPPAPEPKPRSVAHKIAEGTKPAEIVGMHFSDGYRAMLRLTAPQARRAYDEGLTITPHAPRAFEKRGGILQRDITGKDHELGDGPYWMPIKHNTNPPGWLDAELPPVNITPLVRELVYGNNPPPGVTLFQPTPSEPMAPAAAAVAAIAPPSAHATGDAPWSPPPPPGGWKEIPDDRETYGEKPLVGTTQQAARWQRDVQGEGWPDRDKDPAAFVIATMRWAVANGYNPNDEKISGKGGLGAMQYPPHVAYDKDKQRECRREHYELAVAERKAEDSKWDGHSNHIDAMLGSLGGPRDAFELSEPQFNGANFARDLDRTYMKLFDSQMALRRGDRQSGKLAEDDWQTMIAGNQRARAACLVASHMARGIHVPYGQNIARILRQPMDSELRVALMRALTEIDGIHVEGDLIEHLKKHGDKDICAKIGAEWREPGADSIKRIMKKHKAEFAEYDTMVKREDALSAEVNAIATAYNAISLNEPQVFKKRSELRLHWDNKLVEFKDQQAQRIMTKDNLIAKHLRGELGGRGDVFQNLGYSYDDNGGVPEDYITNVQRVGGVHLGLIEFSRLVGDGHTGLDHPIHFDIQDKYTRADYAQHAGLAMRGPGGRVLPADRIRVGKAAAVSTTVHELGHFFEHNANGGFVQRAAIAFLYQRTSGEAIVPLSTIGAHYGPDEFCKPDKFMSPYIGKFYPAMNGPRDSTTTTEVLSMGIEQLHEDPVLFFLRDPEHAAFVLDMLRSGGQ